MFIFYAIATDVLVMVAFLAQTTYYGVARYICYCSVIGVVLRSVKFEFRFY